MGHAREGIGPCDSHHSHAYCPVPPIRRRPSATPVRRVPAAAAGLLGRAAGASPDVDCGLPPWPTASSSRRRSAADDPHPVSSRTRLSRAAQGAEAPLVIAVRLSPGSAAQRRGRRAGKRLRPRLERAQPRSARGGAAPIPISPYTASPRPRGARGEPGLLPCRRRPARHTARHGHARASPMPAPTSPTTASSYNPARASSHAGAGLLQGRAPTSTELRHTNVPFSHPSEGKGQKDGRKVRSCDELPLTLGGGSLCADCLARAARPGILVARRVRLRRCPRRAAAGGNRCRLPRRARD